MTGLFVSGLAGLVYCMLMYRLARAWPVSGISPDSGSALPPVSVLIAAHNEADRLRRYLPSVLSQEYPVFEVIVALDRCTDESEAIIRRLPGGNACRIVTISETPPGWTPKKYALQQAAALARYPWLAFTDADCEPGPQWLQTLAAEMRPDTEVILGIGLYRSLPGLLNAFIRYETLYTAFQYIGMARLGMPYMAVGRNLAYRASFFARTGGQRPFRHRLSGDDDLLINRFAQGQTTAVSVHPDGHTYSDPKTRWSAWFRQKMRHISASTAYSRASQAWLALFHLAHAGTYIGLIWAVWTGWGLQALGIHLLRVAVTGRLLLRPAKILYSDNLIPYLPVLDLLYFMYNLSAVPSGLTFKPAWKN